MQQAEARPDGVEGGDEFKLVKAHDIDLQPEKVMRHGGHLRRGVLTAHLMACRLHDRGAVANPASKVENARPWRKLLEKAGKHDIAVTSTYHRPVFFGIHGISRHRFLIGH